MSVWIEEPMRARLDGNIVVLADKADAYNVRLSIEEARTLCNDLIQLLGKYDGLNRLDELRYV